MVVTIESKVTINGKFYATGPWSVHMVFDKCQVVLYVDDYNNNPHRIFIDTL